MRPGPPPAYDSVQMATEMAEVKNFVRTPQTNAGALFWEYGAGATRNYWFWNEQASRRILENRLETNPPAGELGPIAEIHIFVERIPGPVAGVENRLPTPHP